MRKFTFFLALMVAMVTTAFAVTPEDAATVVETKIALTTEAGQPGYISSPHDHAVINAGAEWDQDGIAALIDGDVNTHFHTAYDNMPEGPHYFQVDLGEGNAISKFSFKYVARNSGDDDFAREFTIKGSNDDSNYELIDVIDFGSAVVASSQHYSGPVGGENAYRYLRFEVTNTKMQNGYECRTYFHMAEFELFAVEEEGEGEVVPPTTEEPEVSGPVVITSVDQLSNAKCYTIANKDAGRGNFYALDDKVDMCGVTYNQAQTCHGVEKNAEDENQQFAFVKYEDNLYLYSVAKKMFVVKNGDVNKLSNEKPYDYVVVNKEDNGYFSLRINNVNYITASPGWCENPSRATCLQTTLTAKEPSNGWDDGAWYTITEVADFNAEEALAMLAATVEPEPEPEPEPSTPVVAKTLADINNENAYVFSTPRSPLCVNADGQVGSYWTTQGMAMQPDKLDLTNEEQQFAFLRTDKTEAGKYYMYSVKSGKFIIAGNVASETPSADITFEENYGAEGYFKFSVGGEKVNVTWWSNSAPGVRLNNDSDPDEGNEFTVYLAEGEFDFTAALAAIDAVENPVVTPLTATFEPDYYAYTYEEDGSVTAADGFGSFKLAFNERLAKPFESNNVKDLALEWVKDGEGNVVEVARVVADMVGGLEIELAARVEAPGVYTLTIPADIVKNYDGSKTYEGGSFVITIPAAETPAIPEYQLYVLANGSPAPLEGPVASVQYMAFTFGNAAITLGENPTVGIFDPNAGTYVANGTLGVDTEMFGQPILLVQFSEPFATAGTYMLHIPENTFMVGDVIYPEVIVEFTIQGSVTPETPETPAITIVDVAPAVGEVEGISELIFTFSDMVDAPQYDDIAVDGPNYSSYEFIYQYDENLSPKQMKFVATTPITAPGEYSFNCEYLYIIDLMGNVIQGFDKTYTWTVKEAAVAPEEPKGDIDVTKEYYLEVEYMAGMSSAKGYITIDGMQNQVYIDSEKKQAFKFELVENGTDIFYTLSTEVSVGTGSSTLYLNCDAAAVMGNATDASELFFEKEAATSDKYYVKSGNAYLRAGDNAEWVGINQAYIVYNEECDPYFRIKLTLVADGEEEPEVPGVTADPLVLVSEPVTVEKINKIELEFDREVASVDANARFKLLKRDESIAQQFMGNEGMRSGNKVTFYLMSPISESGTFTFVIPADAIVAADGGKVAETSYKITVVAAPKPSKTSIEVENSLSTFTIAFSEEIDFVAEHTVEKLEVKAGNDVVAEIPVANIAIDAKNLTLTLDKAITPEGTTQYTVAIPANFITKKGSTTLQYAGGNITVKVKLPFVLKSITPVSGSTVEVFENIVAEYNGAINFVPDALSFKLENIADKSEIALTATKDGNVVTFTTDAEVPNGTYKLKNLNYVVDNSTYLAPAELPEYTITVGDPTAIDGVEAEAENAVIYDLSGRRVNEIVKGGIYIINGKKVLVK